MTATVKTILLFFLIVSVNLYAEDAPRSLTLQYIEQYKSIVINESKRSGIPASIKMAQAIVESGSGTSTLAKDYNNHFGIKCGATWQGKKAMREDDDYNDGLLVKSCFRWYEDSNASFFDHTDFLSKSTRYASLFLLAKTNYVAWAEGLKKAGYATDPNYPTKIIRIIEEYRLYEWDENDGGLFVTNTLNGQKTTDFDSEDDLVSFDKDRAKPTISTELNDHSYRLKDGRYLVRQGDQMSELASEFHVDLKELYIRNRMPFGAEPLAGQQLVVTEYIQFKKPTANQTAPMTQEQYLWEETILIAGK